MTGTSTLEPGTSNTPNTKLPQASAASGSASRQTDTMLPPTPAYSPPMSPNLKAPTSPQSNNYSTMLNRSRSSGSLHNSIYLSNGGGGSGLSLATFGLSSCSEDDGACVSPISSSASTPTASRAPSIRQRQRALSTDMAPLTCSADIVDLGFITGLRSLSQLKCACRKQCPRDPRRALVMFSLLKDDFELYATKPIDQIPERYRPFFSDLRRE